MSKTRVEELEDEYRSELSWDDQCWAEVEIRDLRELFKLAKENQKDE